MEFHLSSLSRGQELSMSQSAAYMAVFIIDSTVLERQPSKIAWRFSLSILLFSSESLVK